MIGAGGGLRHVGTCKNSNDPVTDLTPSGSTQKAKTIRIGGEGVRYKPRRKMYIACPTRAHSEVKNT